MNIDPPLKMFTICYIYEGGVLNIWARAYVCTYTHRYYKVQNLIIKKKMSYHHTKVFTIFFQSHPFKHVSSSFTKDSGMDFLYIHFVSTVLILQNLSLSEMDFYYILICFSQCFLDDVCITRFWPLQLICLCVFVKHGNLSGIFYLIHRVDCSPSVCLCQTYQLIMSHSLVLVISLDSST